MQNSSHQIRKFQRGSRAASSHTGAMATSDAAVEALFRKAGIVRCHSREELTTVCSIFMHPEVKGKNIAIITHAGDLLLC